jgi:hypothetical protein
MAVGQDRAARAMTAHGLLGNADLVLTKSLCDGIYRL